MPNDEAFVNLLADKLVAEQVLFFVGAGLSMNWDFPSGGDLSKWIIGRLRSLGTPEMFDSAVLRELKQNDQENLPLVADVVAQDKCWFLRRVFWVPQNDAPTPRFFWSGEELANGDPLDQQVIGWPHIILGRLAKEGLIDELISTNYDCLLEAGCLAVGMMKFHDGAISQTLFPWVETFRVIQGRHDVARRAPQRRVFHIHKIHGCVQSLASQLKKEFPCERDTPNTLGNSCAGCPLSQRRFNFVLTYRELLDWRNDEWARDLLFDRLRSNHVVFTGFNGSDAILHAALRNVFDEVRSDVDNDVSVPDGRATRDETPQELPNQVVNEVAAAEEDPEGGGIRAQATEKDVSVYIRQILRMAAGMTWSEGPQVWSLGKRPKARLKTMFRMAYARTMERFVRHRLESLGPAWMDRVLAQSHHGTDGELGEALRKGTETRRWLAKSLHDLPMGVWVDDLPAVVRLSWLLRSPQLTAENSHASELTPSLLERIKRPHYYVPVGETDEITWPILTFYLHILSHFRGCPIRWLPGGWILTPTPRTGSGHPRLLILPVVAPRPQNLSRYFLLPRHEIRPPSISRWSGVETYIIILAYADESQATRGQTLGARLQTALDVPALKTKQIPIPSLITSDESLINKCLAS